MGSDFGSRVGKELASGVVCSNESVNVIDSSNNDKKIVGEGAGRDIVIAHKEVPGPREQSDEHHRKRAALRYATSPFGGRTQAHGKRVVHRSRRQRAIAMLPATINDGQSDCPITSTRGERWWHKQGR